MRKTFAPLLAGFFIALTAIAPAYAQSKLPQNALAPVADLTALGNIDTTKTTDGTSVFVSGAGIAGEWVLDKTTDYSTVAAADTLNCVVLLDQTEYWVRREYLNKTAPVHAEWCSLNLDGATDDAAAINVALAVARLDGRRTILPPGNMAVDSGSTITIDGGDWLEGAGLDQTTLTSLGGTAPVIGSDVDGTANFVTLKGFKVKGGDVASSVGIRIEGMQFNSVMEAVEIVDFEQCVYINDSWTFEIRNSRIGASGESCTYGIYAKNWTEGMFYHSRADHAEEHNVYLLADDSVSNARTNGVSFIHGFLQSAGKSNLVLEDVPRVILVGVDFEGADEDDAGSPDIDVTTNGAATDTALVILGGNFTSSAISSSTTPRPVIRSRQGSITATNVVVNDSTSQIYSSFIDAESVNLNYVEINGYDRIQPVANGANTPFIDCSDQTTTVFSIRGEFGKYEGRCIQLSGTDGAISSSDNTFTSAGGPDGVAFTSSFVGQQIIVEGAGSGGADLETTIASYTSGTEVELTDAASTTVSGATFRVSNVPDQNDGMDGIGELPVWMRDNVPGAYQYVIHGFTGNGYLGIDTPDNRRREFQYYDDGTLRWVMGSGDSDECDDDFYINDESGCTTPELTIDDSTGEVTVGQGVFTASAGIDVDGGFFGFAVAADLEIASGAITATKSYIALDIEGSGSGSDDLDTINGGATGDLLMIRSQGSAKDITIKDGTGNINCGSDFTLDISTDFVMLLKQGSSWNCIAKADNGS